MDFVDDCIVDYEEQDLPTQFLQRNQLIDLQDHFERYCNVLSVFGFNSANCDLNSTKSYLLPIFVNVTDNELTLIKKANQFVSSKSVVISYLTLLISSVVRNILTLFSKSTRLTRQN